MKHNLQTQIQLMVHFKVIHWLENGDDIDKIFIKFVFRICHETQLTNTNTTNGSLEGWSLA